VWVHIWSQNRLAEILYTKFNDEDVEGDILKFQERLKKQLQRPTTNVEKLRKYLDVIVRHPQAKNLDLIINKYIPHGSISSNLSKDMVDISVELHPKLTHFTL
jgi:hypothetical protein